VLGAGGLVRVLGPEPTRPVLRFVVPHDRIVDCLERAGRARECALIRTLWRSGRSASASAATGLSGPDLEVLAGLHDEGWLELRRSTGRVRIERCVAAPAARLPLDWNAIEGRQRAETNRLDAMEGYAWTRECRRGYVLRYFGDPDAISSCTGCDRCLAPGGRILAHAYPPTGPSVALRARRWARKIASRLG
jgi:ATP-dependent DNA helicase RecQ